MRKAPLKMFLLILMAASGTVALGPAAGCGGGGGGKTCPAFDGAGAFPALHVDGRWIKDSHGRTVLLRGINTGGRAKLPPFLPWDGSDLGDASFQRDLDRYFDFLADWGVNCIRLTVFWEALEPEQGIRNSAYIQKLRAQIEAAKKRGLWVFVDFHQDIYSRVLGGSGAPAWALPDPNVTPTPPDSFFWFGRYKSDPNVLAAFEHFWGNGRGVQDAFIGTAEFLAGELKDFPNLFGFDLFNEPSPGASKKDDLGAFFEQDLAPFYQRTAAALRRADPRFVVLAGPTGLESFESTTVMKRPDVQNLVFSPHYYDTIVTATRHYSPADSLPAGKIASWNDVGKDWNAPMLISEYGPLQVMDNPGRFLDDLYAAFDKMFVHGTYWTHEISAERWNKEDAGLVDGNWVERTAFTDAFSRPFPACTSGEPAEFVFDRANKQVSFKWSAGDCGGAPTVVKLPARHFPKTPSVELSSGEWKYDGGRHELLVFDRVCEGKTAKGAVQTLKIMP